MLNLNEIRKIYPKAWNKIINCEVNGCCYLRNLDIDIPDNENMGDWDDRNLYNMFDKLGIDMFIIDFKHYNISYRNTTYLNDVYDIGTGDIVNINCNIDNSAKDRYYIESKAFEHCFKIFETN